MVLLPGILSDQRVWSYQIHHLQELVRCQCVPLLRGNTTEDLLQEVLSQVEGDFFLAGHSMGGWLALELARRVPERVLKLCLLNTSAQPDSQEKRHKRQMMITDTVQGNFQAVATTLVDHYIFEARAKKEVLSMFLSVGPQVLITQQKVLLAREECTSFLSSLTMPALVIHAREDKNFSLAHHEELRTKIPHAKLAVIEDSGHMSPMESPQAVTALMRFWLEYF
nr:alpha/beta hydrolase [Fluoribacter dumoffii]